MEDKGFTLIGLITIIGILIILVFAVSVYYTHSGQTFVSAEANSKSIDFMVDVLEQDPKLNIRIMVYAAEWTYENMDALIDEGNSIHDQIIAKGVANDRIVMFYANKEGLELYKGSLTPPTPAEDGVYLVLTYYQ